MPNLKNILLFAISAGLPSAALAEGNWQKVKESDGIRIFTRAVPGAEIRQLKAEARVRSTVVRLLRTYLDVTRHTAWYPGCVSSRILRGEYDGRLVCYHRIDNPWPVQDRDYAFAIDTAGTEEHGGRIARYRNVAGLIPETEGCVRMRKLEGFWKFVPESDGLVAITYVFDFDPGPGAPVSFINMSLPRIGRNMIMGLARGAEATMAEGGGSGR